MCKFYPNWNINQNHKLQSLCQYDSIFEYACYFGRNGIDHMYHKTDYDTFLYHVKCASILILSDF